MSLFRKNFAVFALLALLAACATPQSATRTSELQTKIDCGLDADVWFADYKPLPGGRALARAQVCEDLFKQTAGAKIRVLSPEEGDKAIREYWSKEQFRDRFSVNDSWAFWGTLMGKEKMDRAMDMNLHPEEFYYEHVARNWHTGTRRLNAIPVGKFKIDQTLISQVNRDLQKDVTIASRWKLLDFTDPMVSESYGKRGPVWKWANRRSRWLEQRFELHGGKKRERTLFHSYLKTAMSEEEFQHIKDNNVHLGMRFVEIPLLSKPGARRGYVVYPSPKEADERLQKLLEATNREMDEIRAGRSAKDPIALAAEFQWKFVALHPMTDGNGRTSRVLMNRILAEFGLPPSLRSNIDLDYGLPLEVHTQNVRDGVINYIDQFSQENTLAIGILGRGYGTRMGAAELSKIAGETLDPALLVGPRNFSRARPSDSKFDLTPMSRDQVMHMGQSEYYLGDDGFFYNEFQIPHAARRESSGWKLYPMTERTYALYAYGGGLTGQAGVKRDITAGQREQVGENLKLFLALRKGGVKTENVSVQSYATIRSAREADEVMVYPWQFKVLLEAVTIKQDPSKDNPLDVLIRNRGDENDNPRVGRTGLEKLYFANKKEIDAGTVMGHYMHMYLTFEKIRAGVMKSNGGVSAEGRDRVLAEIDKSQEKMFVAAKKLLEPFLRSVEDARKDSAAMAYLEQHPEFRLMWAYYQRSPLSYQTLQRAWDAGLRDTVTVLRSTARGGVNRLGFMADADQRRYLFMVPALGRFVQKLSKELKTYVRQIKNNGEMDIDPNRRLLSAKWWAEKIAPRAAENESLMAGVDSLLQFVLVHPNANKSLDPENLAPFVVDVLHAQYDLGPKERLSATVNPTYLLRYNEDKGVYGPKFAMATPSIYIIEVPIANATVDNASRFVIQDEVRINSINFPKAARRATVWSMDADANDQFPLPAGAAPARATAVISSIQTIPSGLAPTRATRERKPPTREEVDAALARRPALGEASP